MFVLNFVHSMLIVDFQLLQLKCKAPLHLVCEDKVTTQKRAMEGIIHRRLVFESFSESFTGMREFSLFFPSKQPNQREFLRVFDRVSR